MSLGLSSGVSRLLEQLLMKLLHIQYLDKGIIILFIGKIMACYDVSFNTLLIITFLVWNKSGWRMECTRCTYLLHK